MANPAITKVVTTAKSLQDLAEFKIDLDMDPLSSSMENSHYCRERSVLNLSK
jgi:hypothetical protein